MQVVLQVAEGSQAGRRIWLRGRQTAEVGRSDMLDLCIPDDDQLAESHFLVACDGRLCHVENRSGDKLAVNGKDVPQKRELDDGDVIEAGQSKFLVRITGQPPKASAAPVAEGEPPPVKTAVAAPLPRRRNTDPTLLAGERSFRQALERLDGIPDSGSRPDVMHTSALLCKSLAEIIKVQGRSDEAAPFEQRAEKILGRDDVKEYLRRAH